MKIAMILAAGRGERLKPITEQMPKALCLVNGKPLIEHHVLKLAKAGFERIVINHAYLGGQIRQFLGDGKRYGVELCYSPEPPGALETGGGIVNALPLLGNKAFVTVNSDIYTNFDFSTIDLASNDDVTLVLVRNNPLLNHHGDFGLTSQNRVTNAGTEYTFAGIACYQAALFSNNPIGRYSMAPVIRSWVDQDLVKGTVYDGLWFDIGSKERLDFANKHAR